MDIEDISHSQMILLTLLVSFITSMATGVVVIALNQGNQPSVVQSVNKVIRETIHEVVTPATTTVVATSTPIIIDSSSIAVGAQKNSSSVFVLSSTDGMPLGVATVFTNTGMMVTDASILSASSAVITIGKQLVPMVLSRRDAYNGLAYLTLATSTNLTWTPANINRSNRSLGETVFTLLPGKGTRLARGVIVGTTAATDDAPPTVSTDIDMTHIADGAPLFAADGSYIGMRTHATGELAQNTFMLFNTYTVKVSTSTIK